ncbi:hypothetical protein GCM10022225_48890 [Plantactinospora mayteni]|uniref:Uncharacterized protein n=1 Tax=Plantactinospora mayteni TaxID=566021 RepID=A0ABQ4ESF9_9ACTN|nr:hypothetical protein [Plantactinospora mayteni]GIG97600.1 hypothetical protein Pma05_41730 [Plantactinospora mayteni]
MLDQARSRLVELLPARFQLTEQRLDADRGADAFWQVRDTGGDSAQLVVLARRSLRPREAERIVVPRTATGTLGEPTLLVVTSWFSPRAREVLEARGFSYLDLAGNALLAVDRPAIFIRMRGADRSPNPPSRPPARLRGTKARRLVRLLVEVRPPYRITDLTQMSGMNAGYISQLLAALDDQALVERGRRGTVEDVDWPALLNAASDDYRLTRANSASTYVAPEGATDLYRRLAEEQGADTVVTGSFAASAIAPIAAPAQLVLYTDEPGRIRDLGRLLPAERGADVMLLRPEDPTQMAWPRKVDGVPHVRLSQLVLDLLGGGGRLPEEAGPVIDWMRADEDRWRRGTLREQLK